MIGVKGEGKRGEIQTHYCIHVLYGSAQYLVAWIRNGVVWTWCVRVRYCTDHDSSNSLMPLSVFQLLAKFNKGLCPNILSCG